ncbi:IclR family transcriptional regulator [Nocardia alni]|uniref:IclR family transcriptional regulator n=1 Tax=Nocardia alni TaxID=2815723 RepID=UPI001C226162|nr:IclR family transcriptional regulator [Nocardia alni]
MARFSNGESTFSRLARLFEALGPGTTTVTLTELSQRTGISLPAVSRMVAELVERGWLQRDPQGGFGMGFHIWELVDRGAPMRDLRTAAQPFMSEVHTRVGHNTYLSVRQGGDVLFVEQLAAPGAVRTVAGRADRLPLHASAPGLVLLAHAPIPVQETVLTRPMAALTTATVTDPKALRSMLSDIRRIGAVSCTGFVDPETTSIAVPLRSPDTRVVGALSVVIPQSEASRRVVPLLQRAAVRIGRELAQQRHHAEQTNEDHPNSQQVNGNHPSPSHNGTASNGGQAPHAHRNELVPPYSPLFN